MPLPFDATLKDLVRNHPADWLAVLGSPATGPVGVLSPDLSTVTASTDVVLRLADSLRHLDFQSGPDAHLRRRVLVYNSLLFLHYDLPVHSVVILLRPKADYGQLDGKVCYAPCPDKGKLDFQFEVIRLWQVPVQRLLQGGLGTLPLALLGELPSGVAEDQALPPVVDQMLRRIDAEAPPEEAATLVTAAFVLAGLRVTREEARHLFRGVRLMRESSTYQLILDEGRVQEGRAILLRLGSHKFGPPDPATRQPLEAIVDIERLEHLLDRMIDPAVASWADLLATP